MVASGYRAALARGALLPDAAQEAAARKLEALSRALRPRRFSFLRPPTPRGLYLWGDVGRGKTLLMDLFFADAPESKKERRHFNAFMADMHARIHALRGQEGIDDPIAPVARAIAREARLLCFDEFQVTDVADAMILGRLFEQFFALGTVIVATSNTAPDNLYAGGLNRQLFLPFIAEIKAHMEVTALDGGTDYRLRDLKEIDVYHTPLSPAVDAAMDAAWKKISGGADAPSALTVFGRALAVPRASRGAARFDFAALCAQPLAGADYLALAQNFHTLFIDHIPQLGPDRRNEARRFMLLIDTVYDQGVKLVCSAAAPPDALYTEGDGADAFRRTASRLVEMQSEDYLAKGHGTHQLSPPASEGQAGGDVR